MTDKFSVKARLHSMRYALHGLKALWNEQHNARVHVCIAAMVVALAFLLRMPMAHCAILVLLIAIVLVAEALNTSIEYLCDRVTTEHDPLIGKAKDVAAAGVLIAAISAVLGGVFLFVPLLLRLFT